MNYGTTSSPVNSIENTAPDAKPSIREKIDDLLQMESKVQAILDRIELFLNGRDATESNECIEPRCFDDAVMLSLENLYSIKNQLLEIAEHLGA